MFCIHCGKENAEEALFCQRCGKKFGTTPQDASVTLSPPPYAGPAVPYQSQIDQTQQAALPLSPYGGSAYTAYGSSEPISPPPPPNLLYGGIANPYDNQLPLVTPRKKSRRGLWIILSSIGVILLLLIAVGGYIYANRSTPTKTLDTLCNAYKTGDFQTAYNLFSSHRQTQAGSETTLASNVTQALNSSGGLKDCLVSNVNENGSVASATVAYTFGNGHIFLEHDTLIDVGGIWKVDSAN